MIEVPNPEFEAGCAELARGIGGVLEQAFAVTRAAMGDVHHDIVDDAEGTRPHLRKICSLSNDDERVADDTGIGRFRD